MRVTYIGSHTCACLHVCTDINAYRNIHTVKKAFVRKITATVINRRAQCQTYNPRGQEPLGSPAVGVALSSILRELWGWEAWPGDSSGPVAM